MFGIGMTEIIVIMIVAIIVLGPKRLPEAVKQMAKIFKEVKSTIDEVKSSVVSEIEDIKKLPDVTEKKPSKEDEFEKEFEKELSKPKYTENYQPKREKISFNKSKKEENINEG
jgi:Tat protein translocase TatB subunit